jgi:hypothetical protein
VEIAEITPELELYWAQHYPSKIVTMRAPSDMTDCSDCQVVVTAAGKVPIVRVPWKLNEIELMQLARGGTIWLSCWGGLPPHALEVQP